MTTTSNTPCSSGVKRRVALVTGAGSADGIGFAIARLLRAKGAKVAITSTTDRIFDRLEALGGTQDETYAQTADLTDAAMVSSLTESIEEKLGPVATPRHLRRRWPKLAAGAITPRMGADRVC